MSRWGLRMRVDYWMRPEVQSEDPEWIAFREICLALRAIGMWW